MRCMSTAFLCATLALASAGCADREAVATGPEDAPPGATFEVTPAVAAASGATFVVALGIMAIIACGIACAP